MNRENFFRKYDKIIESFGEAKPSILLHSCCGPCSSSVIELLSQHFDVTVLWYNPNLWPEEEFEKRLATQKQLISCLAEDGIYAGLLTLPWRSEDYFSRIKGLENEPEEGKRCLECFRIRLDETARIAAERGFDWFCTTLTVSSRKDAVVINAIGREAEKSMMSDGCPRNLKNARETTDQLSCPKNTGCTVRNTAAAYFRSMEAAMNKTTRNIVTAAVIGALYAVLTMVLAPISYGPVQCRISEVLCILPFFMPSTTWGLFFGCAIANIASAAGLPDIIFGSLATLIACLCISWCGKHNKKALACLMPVIWNGLIVGAMLTVVVAGLNPIKNFGAFAVFAGEVALGEAAVMFIAGLPLLSWLPKQKFFADYVSRS